MRGKTKVVMAGAPLMIAILVVVGAWGCSSGDVGNRNARYGVPSAQASEPIGHIGTGKSADAVEKAGSADRYVYLLFYRTEDPQTTRARDLIESARKKITRKSEVVEVNVADSSEWDIVKQFGVSRSPMPLVMVLAPNGAIMGGFAGYQLPNDSKLVEAVGSKSSEQALKALQKKNMVALCVQNRKTADNAGAMRTVEEFLKDPKYGSTTAVVTADPADPANAKFITQLGVDPKTPLATTVMLAPPGSVLFTFQGGLAKGKLVSEVQAAAARKSGGCCPPGSGKTCGPTGGTAAKPQGK